MPKYQVTLTYLITVDASNEDEAEIVATYEVGSNPGDFNDVEIEEVPKDINEALMRDYQRDPLYNLYELTYLANKKNNF